MTRIEGLSTAEERQAASRSCLYHALEQAFSFPEAPFHLSVQREDFLRELREIDSDLPYPLPLDEHPELGAEGAALPYQDFQAEYIRLFDVGVGKPPCPLYGGVYLGGRKKVMEETLRFYEYFGLQRSQPSSELPDHITVELEFMHFLTFKEVDALHSRRDRNSYLLAQRDFLERHLARWVPQARKSLERHEPLPFFAGLLALAETFLTQDLAHVRALIAGPSPFN